MNDIRAKNLDTIRQFLACRGPERKETRYPLFTSDGRKQMHMRIDGEDILQDQPFTQWLEESAAMVPQWGFYESLIFETDDPNLFLVRCVGRGNTKFPENPDPSAYICYYINEFQMREGKIAVFRETLFFTAREQFGPGPGLHYRYKGDMPLTMEALQACNREAVDRFLTCPPDRRNEVWTALLSPDAIYDREIQTDWESESESLPIAQWVKDYGQDAVYTDSILFHGDDPNRILAKTQRNGTPYILEFWTENGTITRISEALNLSGSNASI